MLNEAGNPGLGKGKNGGLDGEACGRTETPYESGKLIGGRRIVLEKKEEEGGAGFVEGKKEKFPDYGKRTWHEHGRGGARRAGGGITLNKKKSRDKSRKNFPEL